MKKKVLQKEVLVPFDWVPADAYALRACVKGEATPEQQIRAMQWIIGATRVHDEPYRDGEAGRRDTDFALGRANVGRQILKMLNLPPEVLAQVAANIHNEAVQNLTRKKS